MRRIWSNIVWFPANLFAGLRVTLPLPVSRRSFHISSDQALLLLLAAGGVGLLASYPFGNGPASFDSDAWAIEGARCFLAVILYYVVTRYQGGPHKFVALIVAMSAIGIPLHVYNALTIWFTRAYAMQWSLTAYIAFAWAAWIMLFLWGLAAIARSIRVIYAASWLRTGLLTAALALGSLPIGWALPLNAWYPTSSDEAPQASRARVDTEDTYYAQPRLMDEALAALKPTRRGSANLYFLGFAGTATQDVFLKEVRAAQQLFDERFGTRGRSLLLINNPRTVADTPVASVTNLRRALAGIAHKMNTDEDVLFLFLTSHGSPHEFSVFFPALALDSLSDEDLKEALDDAGIKWRIVVISACYSGSFIAALEDEHTLVLTAAAADKTSFGCSSENDFTYFGDAYINTALRQDRSFVAAFDRAKDIIARREAAEKLTPSEPQISLGTAMAAKLQQLERRATKPRLAVMAQ
jgi:hypothetical protein